MGEPLSIQHIIEFFCVVLNVLPFGILPVDTADRIEEDAAAIWLYMVKAPGPLVLPAAWHPAKAHEFWIIGNTSAEKALLVTVEQSTVLLPPPATTPELLLQAENKNIKHNLFTDR